jgi:hypothetical protein
VFDLLLEVDDTPDSPGDIAKEGLRVALAGANTGVRLVLMPRTDPNAGKHKLAEPARPAPTTTPPRHRP